MAKAEFTAAAFNSFLKEGRLMAARCRGCGNLALPPHSLCPACHGSDMEWTPLKGTGRLAAFSCIAVGPTRMVQEGYDRNNPYCSALVDLDEGVRVSAQLLGVEASRPETIRVGTPLKAEYLYQDEEGKEAALAFRPQG